MKRLVELVVTAAVLTIPAAASAQTLTEAQARAAIAPWYQLFNQPVRGDMKTLQEQILTADYESCSGYLPGDCWGRETSIKVVAGFAKSIPDMKFDIKEILVAGDRVVVGVGLDAPPTVAEVVPVAEHRAEASDQPVADLDRGARILTGPFGEHGAEDGAPRA